MSGRFRNDTHVARTSRIDCGIDSCRSQSGPSVTRTKVLDRLADLGPAIITKYSKTPDHCVLATAIGLGVLAHFGIEAVPQPMRVRVANKIFIEACERTHDGEQPDFVAVHEAGGHILDTGTGDEPRESKGWPGHLVILVPTVGKLLD